MYCASSDATAKGRGAVRVIPYFGRSGEVRLIHLSPWLADSMIAMLRREVDRKDKGPMI